MSQEPILLTPGPSIVPLPVREALGRPIIHHRTKEFQAVLKEAEAGLRVLFGTSQEVLILTSSGTGAMESAVVNLLSAGDEAVVIRGGKFGERWGEICEAFGIKVVNVDPVWGKPLDLAKLQQSLQQHPTVKAVFSTLCETSTGVRFDIAGIKKAITQAGSKALLAVDAISGLGSEPFSMDAFGVDAAVSGSQKGLMLPPGLAFISLSARAWEAVKNSKTPKYYYDLNLAKKAWESTDTPFTPAVGLVIGLVESLRIILKDGAEKFAAHHGANAHFVRDAIKAMGLELYADPSCASNAVTMFHVPAGVDGKELIKQIQSKHGVIVAGGQGKELVGKVIRIATMGAVGRTELDAGLKALESVLKEMGAAAQK